MDNKQLYAQYVKEFLQDGDESAADRYIDANVVTHDGMPGQARDKLSDPCATPFLTYGSQ